MWFVYTILTGVALLDMGVLVCAQAGFEERMGILWVMLYLAVAGGLSFLLNRFLAGRAAFLEEKQVHFTVLGAIAAVALFAAGFILRLQGIGSAESVSGYYEAAKVVEGQRVPQSVHGAVYFYVQLLHAAFLLLGNYETVGIWLQIGLQMAAALLLFLAMRKLAGQIAALVTLGFCMCAPYMVKSALVLSPEMLFFFILSVALGLMAVGAGAARQKDGERAPGRPGLVAAFLMGALTGFCCYLDVLGLVLLFSSFGILLRHRKDADSAGRKALGAVVCTAGTFLSLGICILLDAFLSGKAVLRVVGAWLALYRPEGFRLPADLGYSGSMVEGCVLFGLMALGIFSFWFDGKKERISVGALMVCAVLAASSYGVFTEEMPGFFCLYLSFAGLAGIGLGQCFHVAPVAKKTSAPAEEKPDWEILIDSIEEREALPQEAKRNMPQPQNGGEQETVEQSTAQEIAQTEEIQIEEVQPVRFLENPLPLPKKHVKRVLDYSLPPVPKDDDFDYPVADDDDFDF